MSEERVDLATLGTDGTVGGPGGSPISGSYAGFGLAACACVASTNVALSGLQTIDGYTLSDGDRVLLVAQSTGSQNGAWVAHSGAWNRPTDYASAAVLSGGRNLQILNGSAYGDTSFVLKTSPVTVDTTATTWASAGLPSTVSLVLDPTAIQTAGYAALANQEVRVDISGGSVATTLPNAPPDRTRVGLKVVKVSGTPGSTSATLACAGTDHFNVAGGSTTLTFTAVFQGAIAQYHAADGLWVVQTTDTPLNVALGAGKLGSDGTLGGPSGSPLAASVVGAAPQTNTSPLGAHYDLGSAPVQNGGGSPNMAIGTAFPYIVPSSGGGYSNIAFGAGWRGVLPRDGNLGQITTGFDNTAVGAGTLVSATTAHSCCGIGADCLSATTTGVDLTAMGAQCSSFNTTGNYNTSFGFWANHDNTTGSANTAVGWQALKANPSTSFNTAVGHGALEAYNSGSAGGNVAVGYLAANGAAVGCSGDNNTVVGTQAMTAFSSAGSCVAIGYEALFSLTTGSFNTAVGEAAANMQTTATWNTSIGWQAAFTNTTGLSNTAVGAKALYSNPSAGRNTAMGYQALSAYNGGTNGNNTAIGYAAMQSNNGSGDFNTGIGSQTMFGYTTGGSNAALGYDALFGLTTGSFNVAVGVASGNNIVTGSTNTCLGYFAGDTDGTTASTDVSNATMIGERAQATTSNVIVLGKATATRPNMVFGAVGASALFGGGVGVFAIAPAFTNPTTNPTGAGILYADHTTTELKWRDPNGVVSSLSYLATGSVALVGGTVAVANASITANAIVLVYSIKAGGTVGALSVTPNAGTGFTINSTSGSDTSTVYYRIVSY